MPEDGPDRLHFLPDSAGIPGFEVWSEQGQDSGVVTGLVREYGLLFRSGVVGSHKASIHQQREPGNERLPLQGSAEMGVPFDRTDLKFGGAHRTAEGNSGYFQPDSWIPDFSLSAVLLQSLAAT